MERFWAKVNKTETCWLWTGAKTVSGYGKFLVDTKVMKMAHRISWELANQRYIPLKMLVCHTCDTPLCVNPAHLFLGTHQSNMADKVAKGRGNNVRG